MESFTKSQHTSLQVPSLQVSTQSTSELSKSAFVTPIIHLPQTPPVTSDFQMNSLPLPSPATINASTNHFCDEHQRDVITMGDGTELLGMFFTPSSVPSPSGEPQKFSSVSSLMLSSTPTPTPPTVPPQLPSVPQNVRAFSPKDLHRRIEVDWSEKETYCGILVCFNEATREVLIVYDVDGGDAERGAKRAV